jgi:hypothetical protein
MDFPMSMTGTGHNQICIAQAKNRRLQALWPYRVVSFSVALPHSLKSEQTQNIEDEPRQSGAAQRCQFYAETI